MRTPTEYDDLRYVASDKLCPDELRDAITSAIESVHRARQYVSTSRDKLDKATRAADDTYRDTIQTLTAAVLDDKRISLTDAIAKHQTRRADIASLQDAYKLAERIESTCRNNVGRLVHTYRADLIQWVARHRAVDLAACGDVLPPTVRAIHKNLAPMWHPRHDTILELSDLYHNGKLARLPIEWSVAVPSMVRASIAWMWQQVALGHFVIATDDTYAGRIRVTSTVEQLPDVPPTPANYRSREIDYRAHTR